MATELNGRTSVIGHAYQSPLLEEISVIRKFTVINLSTGSHQMIYWKRPAHSPIECQFYYTMRVLGRNGLLRNLLYNSEGPHLLNELQRNTHYTYSIVTHLGSRNGSRIFCYAKQMNSGEPSPVPYNFRVEPLIEGLKFSWNLSVGSVTEEVDHYVLDLNGKRHLIPNDGSTDYSVDHLESCYFYTLYLYSVTIKGHISPRSFTCGTTLSTDSCNNA
ncbi:hypothetical protein EG68_03694 [Paragonimus skrjabini miyazakii]|uniref:Fibronectin type-III domain-containing protein n=1 Tax=Paragonimus skrjabini miyazakii TaxID=59628 RepID=A0A8S9YVN0_9TREM|nr:hypothetical protein EG68_03694 [Paragonimus skrjabini miyazakii]